MLQIKKTIEKINDLKFHIKKLEKQQIKPKVNRLKGYNTFKKK